MASMKSLGAGWKKPAKKDGEYINVRITQDIPKGSYIQIWANDRKLSEKHPDYNVVCYVQTEQAELPLKK